MTDTKKFTIEKEIEVDDLPDEMMVEITEQIFNECYIGFGSDGKNIYVGNSSFGEDVVHRVKIEDEINSLDKSPDTAAKLIPTLEAAIVRLKEIVAEWEKK